MTHDNAGYLAIIVTLLTGFSVTLWKGASMITSMQAAITELRAMFIELKAGLADLKEIPLLKQRISTLEDVVQKSMTSRMETFHTKMETVWAKLFSMDKHQAVHEAHASYREKLPTHPEIHVKVEEEE